MADAGLKEQLAEAKEIIKKLIEFGLCDRCTERADEEKELVGEAEQFLSKVGK